MKYQYSQDMFFESGWLGNWMTDITLDSNGSQYNWAIIDSKENLIGYFGYEIDFYSGNMQHFSLLSFDRGNPIIGKSVFEEIERCIKEYNLHRIEWRMIGGNPAERGYDAFLRRHNGKKHILTDAVKDRYGKYHDNIIYEIIIED